MNFYKALLGVWLMISVICRAEGEMFHRAIETIDGLPDNRVTGLAHSPDGYFWVATAGGLVRSNGTSFSDVSLQSFNRVKTRAVEEMLFDRHGQLWIGMKRGPLVRLGRHGGKVFSAEEGAFDSEVLGMAEGGEGVMWVAYREGLCRVEGDVVERLGEGDGMPFGAGFQLANDGEGAIWFLKGEVLGKVVEDRCVPLVEVAVGGRIAGGIEGGVWISEGGSIRRFDGEKISKILAVLPEGASAEVMQEEIGGDLLIGSNQSGLFRLRDGKLQSLPTSSPHISCLLRDGEGNLWAGTDGGGLNLVRERAISIVSRKDGLPFEWAVSACEGTGGKIWAVGRNGDITRGMDGRWEVVDFPQGRGTCVVNDGARGILLGTSGDGIWRFSDDRWELLVPKDVGNVRGLYLAADGSLWIAVEGEKGMLRFSMGGLSEVAGVEDGVVAIAETPDGKIWVATELGEVLASEGESFVREPGISENSPVSARVLASSADGSLWIGYGGDGVGRYKNGNLTMVTTAQGLADNYISQLIEDGDESLWIIGNKGLFQVGISDFDTLGDDTRNRVRSRVFRESEGLPALHPSQENFPPTASLKDGRLIFSTRDGLVIAQPDRIDGNPRPPKVLIEQVTMDDELVALYGNRATLQRMSEGKVLDLSLTDRLLDVPPDYRKLQFQFAALSFSSPENVHFRYRLKGFDKDWVDAETEHTAAFPRLPAGRYIFEVIASNNAGVWNEQGQSLAIRVSPFFWQTWWFRFAAVGGALLTMGAIVFILQRRRHKRQLLAFSAKRAIEEERARIARDIHDDLGSNLTRIMLLSQPGKGDEETLISQIHVASKKLIRKMGAVVWAVNPEQDSLEGLADFFSSYAQEFLGVAGIRCRLNMPMEFPEWEISAQIRHSLLLAFQEALSNVAKHSGASEVKISLRIEDRGFVIEIEDDGSGISPSNEALRSGGYGITSMTERLRMIAGQCEVRDREDGGTFVKFSISLSQKL